jgi:hypothetical protein
MGERRGAWRVLVGTPERKRPIERPGCRWENNVKMDFQEMGWDSLHWIDLARDRNRWRAVVNAVMNVWFPKGKNFLTG